MSEKQSRSDHSTDHSIPGPGQVRILTICPQPLWNMEYVLTVLQSSRHIPQYTHVKYTSAHAVSFEELLISFGVIVTS